MNRVVSDPDQSARQAGLSYKFQRLREKIRRAVESGELQGKLPGERILARRFHVNAKTLSKALTDLAAEGVLERSIGRGTYVKGAAPQVAPAVGRWLVICDPGEENACPMPYLQEACPGLEVVPSVDEIRPSFLSQFTAVVDLAAGTPEPALRGLLVRNLPVVRVNREPQAYSVHVATVDVALGASRLGRDLLLAGHRRLGAIEPRGSTLIVRALRDAAARYAPDAVVEPGDPGDVAVLAENGMTALVCGSAQLAGQARHVLAEKEIAVPGRVSLAAVGCACEEAGCSGYFVPCRQIAATVASLLSEPRSRPTTLWLAGVWTDRGTLAAAGHPVPLHLSPAIA